MSQEVYELDTGLKKIAIEIKKLTRKTLGPVLVGVAGGSGSGKTTKVAGKIKEMFLGAQILSLDDYCRGIEFVMKSIGAFNLDTPEAYEINLLASHLLMLKRGKTVQKPVYSFKDGKRHGYEDFQPKDIIIVEGLFALHRDIVDKLDLKIFVDVTVHGSLIRRIIRDTGRTGQSEEEILRQYVETVYPMFCKYVGPTKKDADIIIINQYMPEQEAASCESREIQLKAEISGMASLFGKIRWLGFEPSGMIVQKDTYYAAFDWSNDYTNELMRVRQENGRYFLAYKGPEGEGACRIRPKIEFETGDNLKNALEKLGYKEILAVEKAREMFLGRGLELMVDTFEDRRQFIEIRTADPAGEAKIRACFEELGIYKENITKKSYLEIMREN